MRSLVITSVTALAIDPSAAALVTAVVGGVVGIGGLVLNRFSQREQARQQTVVDQAAKDSRDLSQTQQALDATVKRAEMAEAGEARKQARIDQLEDELDEERRLRRTELDEERSLRRHMLSAQESVCREVTGELVDTLISMRGVVRDEITRAAVDDAVDTFTPHPHEPRALPPSPGPSSS